MKPVFLFVSLAFLASAATAQEYITSLGARMGYASGLTLKHFLTTDHAIEGIFSTRWNGFVATGLYEVHAPLGAIPRANWYYGGGVHAGFWDGRRGRAPWFDGRDNYTVVGVDAILGMEIMIPDLPIAVSIDWKPALNLVGRRGYWEGDAAISLRYTFN